MALTNKQSETTGGFKAEYRYFNGGVFELHITTPQLEPTDKWNRSRRVYRLTQRFCVRISYPGGSMNATVPAGFETDLASFPRVLQLILGNRDDYLESAVLHDWLYREAIPPFFSNTMMRVVMKQMKTKWWKQVVIYYGLMLFGYLGPFAFLWKRKVR